MLTQVHRLGDSAAAGIAAEYPSLRSLMMAYERVEPHIAEGLLANCKVRRASFRVHSITHLDRTNHDRMFLESRLTVVKTVKKRLSEVEVTRSVKRYRGGCILFFEGLIIWNWWLRISDLESVGRSIYFYKL